MSKPYCSFVVPVYNGEKYLPETIDSILEQNYPSFELVLVNDCSQDRSLEIIQSYIEQHPEKIRLVHHVENQGMVQTLRDGIQHAQGSLVALTGHDDISMPDRLSKQVAALQAHNVSMVASNGLFLRDTVRTSELVYPHWDTDGFVPPQAFLFWSSILGPATLFRKDDFLKVDPKIFQFRHSIEWILFHQLALLGGLYYMAEPLVYYRQHGSNLSKSIFATDEFKLYRTYCRKAAWKSTTLPGAVDFLLSKWLRRPIVKKKRTRWYWKKL